MSWLSSPEQRDAEVDFRNALSAIADWIEHGVLDDNGIAAATRFLRTAAKPDLLRPELRKAAWDIALTITRGQRPKASIS